MSGSLNSYPISSLQVLPCYFVGCTASIPAADTGPHPSLQSAVKPSIGHNCPPCLEAARQLSTSRGNLRVWCCDVVQYSDQNREMDERSSL